MFKLKTIIPSLLSEIVQIEIKTTYRPSAIYLLLKRLRCLLNTHVFIDNIECVYCGKTLFEKIRNPIYEKKALHHLFYQRMMVKHN